MDFDNAARPLNTGPFACPCCGYTTLPVRGGDEICQVCFWEDDGQDDIDEDDVRGGPNHLLSLTQARENYRTLGACDERWLQQVRPPMDSERPTGEQT